MSKTLPPAGWLTHTEQIGPDVGEFWQMKTEIDARYSVQTVPVSPAHWVFETKVFQAGQLLTVVLGESATVAKENHYIAVRAVIDGKLAAANLSLSQNKPPVRA